jgi:hypothetical protein
MEDNTQEIMESVHKVADLSELKGTLQGKMEILEWLIRKGALRESMLPGMHVLYTEEGPIDVHLDSEGIL